MITPAQSPSVSGHGHHHHHHHQGSSSSSSSSHSCSSALKQKRKRKRTSAEQLAVLEGVFRSNQHPNLTLRNQLAVQLLMTPRSVQKWFQNRRAKARNQLSPKSGSSSSSSPPSSGSPAAIDLTNASGLVHGLLGGVMNLNAAQGLLPATLGANPNVAMNTTGLVAALNALQQQQQQQLQQSQQQQFQQQQHLPSLSNLMLLSNAAPLVNELQKEAMASSLENPNVISNGPMTLQDLCNISRFNSLVGNQLAAAAAVAAASQFSPSPSSSFDASFAALRKTASPQQPARPSSFSLPGSVISSQNVLAPIAVKPSTSTLPSLPAGDTKPVNGLMLLSGIAGLMSDDAAGGKALPSPRSLQAGVPTDSEAQASPATLGLSPSQSALFAACVNANEAQLLELMEQGADLNASDINGNTPLLVAARSGHTAIVKALVRGRVNVNAENKSGVNAVYLAAKFGHLATLDFLLQNGATPNKAEGQCLETALHAATNQGFIQIMQSLLDAGANVNAKDSAGRCPLHLHSGFTSVVKLLVGKGADVHATDSEGLTALHYAVRDGQVNAAQCLLSHGARLEDRTKTSMTPLHLVSKSDVAELLLEHKADFKAQTSEGKTILHLVVEKVDAELLSWLMEKGPGAELLAIRDSSGLTPFELAEKKGILNVVQYLKTVTSGNNSNNATTTNSANEPQQAQQQA